MPTPQSGIRSAAIMNKIRNFPGWVPPPLTPRTDAVDLNNIGVQLITPRNFTSPPHGAQMMNALVPQSPRLANNNFVNVPLSNSATPSQLSSGGPLSSGQLKFKIGPLPSPMRSNFSLNTPTPRDQKSNTGLQLRS